MPILTTSRATMLCLATALLLGAPAIGIGNAQAAIAGRMIADDDRAPHLYPMALPGTLGCVDDAYSRVTWGCD
jgi:hypothetical protein